MPTIPSVWRERDFIRLWAATTASMFGSFVTRTALPFAAILVLGAGAGEVAILRSAELVAGLALGLIAGAWVDRLRRRPILIWADLGRAVLLGTIPIAFAFGALTLVQLVVVAFGAAVLTTFFDIGRPGVPAHGHRPRATRGSERDVDRQQLRGGVRRVRRKRLAHPDLSAPIAIAVDAVSFLVSAVLLGGIRAAEPPPRPPEHQTKLVNEIREGLRLTLRDPILRPLALADAAVAGFWGVFGAVYLVFATEIGFEPGVIGLVAAIGGLSSLAGATFAGRAVRRLGVARFFIGTMVLVTIGNAFIALTPDAAILGLACLLAQQLLSDSSLTAFDVVAVSIRQAIVDDRELGRVVASFHTLAMATMLLGTVIGGLVAELVGVRAALVVAASGGPVAIAILWFSRIRRMHDLPAALRRPDAAVLAGDDVPLSE